MEGKTGFPWEALRGADLKRLFDTVDFSHQQWHEWLGDECFCQWDDGPTEEERKRRLEEILRSRDPLLRSYIMSEATILQANVLEGIPLADKSVDCIVTSPPFWGLRIYGNHEDELGREPLAQYVDRWLKVSQECHRVLKDDGLMWLNIGDTASKSGGAGGDYNAGGNKDGKPKWRQGDSGYGRMTWCNVPGKLVEHMIGPPEEDELWPDPFPRWLLRQTIIWDKGMERPESLAHIRRPRLRHEFIYLFSKGTKHRFHHESLEETGSIWHFKPESSGTKGLAPFPAELAVRCIMPSTAPGEIVLDPFCGGGMTTPRVAEELGRVGIGCDLYVVGGT